MVPPPSLPHRLSCLVDDVIHASPPGGQTVQYASQVSATILDNEAPTPEKEETARELWFSIVWTNLVEFWGSLFTSGQSVSHNSIRLVGPPMGLAKVSSLGLIAWHPCLPLWCPWSWGCGS